MEQLEPPNPQTNSQRRQPILLWQVIIDVLTNPCFEPYIHFTGNGLEFVTDKKRMELVQFNKRKHQHQMPTENIDPMIRWRGDMIIRNQIEIHLRGLRGYYPRNVCENMEPPANRALPYIVKSDITGGYSFDDLHVIRQLWCTLKHKEYKQLAQNAMRDHVSLWHYLATWLEEKKFRPYITWLGDEFAFRICNPSVIFSELAGRITRNIFSTNTGELLRLSEEPTVTMQQCWYILNEMRVNDPYIQHADNLEALLNRQYIIYIDDQIQNIRKEVHQTEIICDYLHWTPWQLNNYIRQVAARKGFQVLQHPDPPEAQQVLHGNGFRVSVICVKYAITSH